MPDDTVRSAGPLNAFEGFAGRPTAGGQGRQTKHPSAHPRAVDRVSIGGAAEVAASLLRERVLASTRRSLDLGDADGGPEFAEIVDGEPVAAFVGRLLSAQNLLAARRAGTWPEPRLRRCLDEALRAGAAEAMDLVGADGEDARQWIADVLAEYARRVAPPEAAPPTDGSTAVDVGGIVDAQVFVPRGQEPLG